MGAESVRVRVWERECEFVQPLRRTGEATRPPSVTVLRLRLLYAEP